MEKKCDLRKRRKELGLTLAQVAQKAGLTAPGVRSIENGLFRGKLATRQRLAQALDVPFRSLMTDEERRVTDAARVPVKLEAFMAETKMTPDEVWAELRRLGRG
jgi:transcriptional regulator with XRE-family HTH domain